MGKETNPKINIWAKHAQTIKNHKVKTIKTLVTKLKSGAGKIPLIKGIGKNDAVAMLIDIGLSAVPFAVRYKNKLLSKFKNAPEKVDYKTLLSSLEEITREEDINEKERSYIEAAIKKAKSSKDPFNDNTLLSEHRITAPIFRKTIIDEIASTVKLKEEEILKLKQTYKSLKILIDSKNAQIKKATGIEVEKIKKIKAIVNWTEFEHVSVPIAHAFVIKKVELQTIIETSTEDVQKIIKDSGITITRNELNDIGKVINAVRTKMPAEAYYFDVISSFTLPKAAHEYLKKKNINNFYDLLKNGGPDNLIKKGKIKNKKLIENIEAYTFLSVLSNDTDINAKLINKGYNAPFTIAKISRSKFISDMKADLGNSKATLLFDKALKQSAYLNNIATAIAVDTANGYSNGLNTTFDFAPTQTCKCNDNESAVSPLAYLADLLRYTLNHVTKLDHVTKKEDNIKISDLIFYLHQPFDRLPASGESIEKEVRQARIAIEVLRKSLPDEKQKELQAAEKEYCLAAYHTLLMRIGTNLEEIRLSRMADDEKKQDIANKLALDDISRLNELRIHPDDLTEQKIQTIFGLADTDPKRKDPLASLPVSKLEKWRLGYLYNTWQKEDCPNNKLPDDQLILDPDIIGPDDFKYPFSNKIDYIIEGINIKKIPRPYDCFRLWLKRRHWIDARLITLKKLKTVVREENVPDMQGMLNSMYRTIYYNYHTPRHKIPWKNETTINDLDTLYRKLNRNNDQEISEAERQIKEDLLLQKDAFCRLMELKNKHHKWMDDPQNERLTDEEWCEFISILVQAQKNRFFDYWKEEENNKHIELTPYDFWISATEPKIGVWPPMNLNEEPLVDPEKTNLNDLPERKAGGNARRLWQYRKKELITISENLKDILPDYKNALLIALGNKNKDDDLELPHNLEDLKDDLANSEPEKVAAAERKIVKDLFMTIEDFTRLMAIIEKFEKDDATKKPSESEQKEFVRVLTSAQKKKRKYPEWNDRENVIPYWNARKAKLPKWRASASQRAQWQNILRIRSMRPIIDPDIIELVDIKNLTTDDPAFRIWNDRYKKINEKHDIIQQKRKKFGLDGALLLIAHIDDSELENLNNDEQNGHNINPYLQQIHLTRAAFAYLLSIRKLIAQNEPILEEEWDDVDSILLQLWKEHRYYHWREEEKEQDLILSPEFFLVERSIERSLKKWRSTQNTLWEWQDKLDARIDQQQSVRAGLQKAISDTEELTLPAFRDALVKVHNLSSSLEQEIMADILSKRFLISMRESGCHITTRVSQAIVTIQGLLHSLRMDLWKNMYPGLKLESPSFDEDWKWMGSYATWRAAMFLFLYPENILAPNLHRQRTYSFTSCYNTINSDTTDTPNAIQLEVQNIKRYLFDQTTIEAKGLIETPVENQYILVGQSHNRIFWAIVKKSNANELEELTQ